MMKNQKLKIGSMAAVLFFLASAMGIQCGAKELSGQWRFELDRSDSGINERWFDRNLASRIRLPGNMPAQGIGDAVSTNTAWMGGIVDRSWFTAPEFEKYRQPGNIKVPFWLQPENYYAGIAWYQRDIDVPAGWKGKRVVVSLERPHWETRLWIDDKLMGTNNSLATPHDYDLGVAVAPGKHRLTIRVDNRMVVDVGHDSHSVSDHTQGNWNGIVGEISLSATDPVWISDLQVFPHAEAKSVTIQGLLGNASGQMGRGTLLFDLLAHKGGKSPLSSLKIEVSWNVQGGAFRAEWPLANQGLQNWDEFNPALYEITARLDNAQESKKTVFGFRQIGTQKTEFLVNGRKAFFRGTLECCIFPKTGHPPTDVASWKRIIEIAKAHGLNNIRFHSWCPPEAAFLAADELGFYYQVECSSWANSTTGLGLGKPIDAWIYEEADRILKYYGNHPSFVLMTYGNEPGGKDAEYLKKWVTQYKQKDSRRLYTSASGWPQIPENQFHVTPDPRIQAWGSGLKSRINALPPETVTDYRDYIQARNVPVISHEIGQWCVYPNFDEMRKYTGYLKPRNFEIFRESLQAHHMGDLAKQFLMASGKLQALCYKEEIESALRTPGMGGFQLLDLHDFPGQGTALVGVLDPFWEGKGYISAREFNRFCGSSVLLARMPKRILTQSDAFIAQIEIAHYGPATIEKGQAKWRITDAHGKTFADGVFEARDIPVGNGIRLGEVNISLRDIPAPSQYRLVTGMNGVENDWDIWVYPSSSEEAVPQDIKIVADLNAQALEILKQGGKVLLMPGPARVKSPVQIGFSSIFWNTVWTRNQAPHTLGILCNPKHPALEQFPTESHSNWQWWELIHGSAAMVLDPMPATLRPIIQPIDTWFENRRLGLLFEASVNGGKLLVCSMDLTGNLDRRPVARQMRHSLIQYMSGKTFSPKENVDPATIRSLFQD